MPNEDTDGRNVQVNNNNNYNNYLLELKAKSHKEERHKAEQRSSS